MRHNKFRFKILPVLGSLLLFGTVFLSACDNSKKEPVLSENWSFDDEHHWKTAEGSDEKFYFSGHNYVEGVCTLCKYKKVEDEKEPDTSDIPLLPDGENPKEDGGDEDDPSEGGSEEDPSKGEEFIEGLSYTELYDEQGVVGYSVAAGDLRNEKEITIPASFRSLPVLEIAEKGFAECFNLEKIEIPALETVGYKAFQKCKLLKSVTFTGPGSVKEISDWAFADCVALEEFTVPEGIEYLRYKTFSGCLRLKKVTLPQSIVRIGNKAFYGCSMLQNISLPPHLKEIGSYAFYQCYVLNNLTFPEGLTEVGHYAFYECRALTSVSLPDSVTWIGYEVFYGCSSLRSAKLSEQMTVVNWSDFYDCISLESIVLSDNITAIENYAFANCRSLTYAELGKGLQRIGSCVFMYCVSLDSVSFRGTRAQWETIPKGTWWDYSNPNGPQKKVLSVIYI